MERVCRRAHQRLHRAHILLDPGAAGAELLQHTGQGGVVVERIQQAAHAGVHCGDGGIVVAELAGAALLTSVGGGALHVAEDDVEDVDHVVAGAAGERVDVGGQGRDPALGTQVGQLG
ncbi:MAG: hypothetical protein ACRDOH_14380 [Streptosporangiaceae bacterium]